MPSYTPYVEDVDVSPSEFVDDCSTSEIKELIEALIENDYILPSQNTLLESNFNVNEIDFEEQISKLHGRKHQLSSEDEEIIISICKKLI